MVRVERPSGGPLLPSCLRSAVEAGSVPRSDKGPSSEGAFSCKRVGKGGVGGREEGGVGERKVNGTRSTRRVGRRIPSAMGKGRQGVICEMGLRGMRELSGRVRVALPRESRKTGAMR